MALHYNFTDPAPADFDLPANSIHVWCASLTASEEQVQELARHLSSVELDRAAGFYFEEHRRRFIVCRGTLRVILGAYARLSPADLQFVYGDNGKPALADDLGGLQLRFNLSHSSELAIYAIVRGHEVGIDIERVRPVPDAKSIAGRNFSAGESQALFGLPDGLLLEAFFDCWTRKEAYLKALGKGLSLPLDEFEVSVAPGERARMVGIQGDAERAARWSLFSLRPQVGYIGALAAEGFGGRISCSRWTGHPYSLQSVDPPRPKHLRRVRSA